MTVTARLPTALPTYSVIGASAEKIKSPTAEKIKSTTHAALQEHVSAQPAPAAAAPAGTEGHVRDSLQTIEELDQP